MKNRSFQIPLAPDKLWQSINPWRFFENARFGIFNIELGQTPRPDIEADILDQVGSYGRQLGRIGDALEVILDHVRLDNLNDTEKSALKDLRDQLAGIRQVKRRLA